MDGTDRQKLPALEIARREHLKKYGSMLHCDKGRSKCCSFMYGAWITGCQRPVCILDDEEDQALQKRIEEKRNRRIEEERRHGKREEKAAPIRDQRNRIRSYEQIELAAIHRLEEKSRQAFYNNNPDLGHTLFNRAGIRRQELKKYIEQKQGKAAPTPGANT